MASPATLSNNWRTQFSLQVGNSPPDLQVGIDSPTSTPGCQDYDRRRKIVSCSYGIQLCWQTSLLCDTLRTQQQLFYTGLRAVKARNQRSRRTLCMPSPDVMTIGI